MKKIKYKLVIDDENWFIDAEKKKTCISISSDGAVLFYKNNKLHRKNGPAIVTGDGDDYWYLNGEHVAPPKIK